ncbi:unnamed protein product [Amoebophrya sp. A25]|nr:unnamed protein product [Amoebophrya sp. A25]|eukprot:GSA25T00014958001.1
MQSFSLGKGPSMVWRRGQSFGEGVDEGILSIAWRKWYGLCRAVSNNNGFAIIMTLLTVYALVGDDIRLACTERQHDYVFNGLTYACLGMFALEVFVYSFGKPDYYGGFFFYLDVLSTMSLILDITWVAEELFTSSDEDGSGGGSGGVARVGRASRAGTRMGRIVRVIRVIRLVRIFKLYKAHLERKRKQERELNNALLSPGERQVFADANEDEEVEESRVGKKLSEMTTIRVIMVVLVMLVAVPMFRSDGLVATKDNYMDAASYAATTVWDSFREYMISHRNISAAGGSATVDQIRRRDAERHAYESKHLHYIYYHNPHGEYEDSVDSKNPHSVKDTIFWVGFLNRPQDNATTLEIAQHAVLGDVSKYSDPYWSIPSTTWDSRYARREKWSSNALVHKENLMATWDEECSESLDFLVRNSFERKRYGASIAYPQNKGCPKGLRPNEVSLVAPVFVPSMLHETVPDLDKMVFIWYFDLTKWTSLEAIFNMFQTLFVLFLLVGGNALFSRDANQLVLYPVERMITRLAKIRSNPFEAIRMSEEELRREAEAARANKLGKPNQPGKTSKSVSLMDHQHALMTSTGGSGDALLRNTNGVVKLGTLQSTFGTSRSLSGGLSTSVGERTTTGEESATGAATSSNPSTNNVGTLAVSPGPASSMMRALHRQRRQSLVAKLKRVRDRIRSWWWTTENKNAKLMETVILEKTIIKLGGLCALAFGEAGSAVIGHNMKESDTTSAINTMVDGTFMDAVFGFCDIRNFTDATEILEDGVMLFVNRISEIVHTLTDQHCGSPNKNIGDAFLLVWRLGRISKDDRHNASDLSGDVHHSGRVQRIGELATMCFVRIIAATNRSPVLATYRLHEGLLSRMANYRVKMGFGLHRGWAIEGAIGSEFKVDASYLSPHVNLSAQLEAATKQYGVPLLISEYVATTLSTKFRRALRRVDRVMVSGIKNAFYLYTLDCDPLALRVIEPPSSFFESASPNKRRTVALRQRRGGGGEAPPRGSSVTRGSPGGSAQTRSRSRGAGVAGKAGRRVNAEGQAEKNLKVSTFNGQKLTKKDEFNMRMAREQRKEKFLLDEDFDPYEEFRSDVDIRTMTENFTAEFHHRFGMAFVNYESGEWSVAKQKLQEFQRYVPEAAVEEDISWLSRKRLADGTMTASPVRQPGARHHAAMVKNKKAIGGSSSTTLDGPSQCLLNYMQQYDFEAPSDWPGYRTLSGV